MFCFQYLLTASLTGTKLRNLFICRKKRKVSALSTDKPSTSGFTGKVVVDWNICIINLSLNNMDNLYIIFICMCTLSLSSSAASRVRY